MLRDFENIKHNKTVRSYCDAIVKLVEKYSVEDITVSMIIEEAETSRHTFYRYFFDKYALMNYVYYHDMHDMYYSDLIAYDIIAETGPKKYLEKIDYYRKIAKINGQNSYRNFISCYIYEYFKDVVIAYVGKENYSPMDDFSVMMFVKGELTLYFDWLDGKFPNMTLKDFGQTVYALIPENIKPAFDNNHGLRPSVKNITERLSDNFTSISSSKKGHVANTPEK